MITMDRRAAVEQHYRSSGGDMGGKKRRVGVRLKRSASTASGSQLINSHLVSGEEQQESGAIVSLAYEINAVVQEQEEVLGQLKRKTGLFRGLGDRFKSAIRGTDGEQDLTELRDQLNWLRKKEAQLREEKLILLIKDVSEQPSLQAPGAVAAAVASASAADTASESTPLASRKRSGLLRSASMGLGRSSTKTPKSEADAAGGGNDKDNRGASVDSKVRQALSRRRHSVGRGTPGKVGPEHHGSRRDPARARRSRIGVDAMEVDGNGDNGGGGVPVPDNIERPHISSFKLAHMMSAGGETYLAPSERHGPRRFQSSGGIPISGSIWCRPMVSSGHPASSAGFRTEPGGNICTEEAVAAAAAAAAAVDLGSVTPYASSRKWHRLDTATQLAPSQGTAGDVDLSATVPISPGVRSELSSPARLMRTRASTNWEREMRDKAREVMMRHSVIVDSETMMSVSTHSGRNSGTWTSVTGSAAPPSTADDTDAGEGVETAADDDGQRARNVCFVTQPKSKKPPVSPATAGNTEAAAQEASSPAAPAAGGDNELAAAKTELLGEWSSSSFEAPCEMDRLIPAAERNPSSRAPTAVEHELAQSHGNTPPPTSKAGALDDAVGRELVPSAAVVSVGDTGTGIGVDTLSTLPSGLPTKSGQIATENAETGGDDAMIGADAVEREPVPSAAVVSAGGTGVGVEMLSTPPSNFPTKPSEIVEIAETSGEDAMADAAAVRAPAGDGGVTPTKVRGTGADKTRRSSCAERIPSETAPSVSATTTLAVDTTCAFPVTPPPAAVAARAPAQAKSARPPKPHHRPPVRHPLASMDALLTSCFAFVDATDGNSSLPEPLRKEMKRNAINAARNAEVSEAVKLETPPSLWVSRYEDMSKKYGLGFVLSDGSSGVTFKDGTKMALDTDGAVFEYVEGIKGNSSSRSRRRSSHEPGGASSETVGSEPSTEDAAAAAAAGVGEGPQAEPGEAGKKKLARQSSGHHGGSSSVVQSGGGAGELQQNGRALRQQQQRRRMERVGYALADYPAHYGKKVNIAQKVRELLQRAAGGEDSAAGSLKSLATPAPSSVHPGANAFGKEEGQGGRGGAAAGGGGFGGTLVTPGHAGTGGGPLIFVDDWKRTRSSWIFRLSNRTLQVVFLDATEILLTEEARLITFVDKVGHRETMALLRALDQERLDVIVRVRECHALIDKLIRHDERRRRS